MLRRRWDSASSCQPSSVACRECLQTGTLVIPPACLWIARPRRAATPRRNGCGKPSSYLVHPIWYRAPSGERQEKSSREQAYEDDQDWRCSQERGLPRNPAHGIRDRERSGLLRLCPRVHKRAGVAVSGIWKNGKDSAGVSQRDSRELRGGRKLERVGLDGTVCSARRCESPSNSVWTRNAQPEKSFAACKGRPTPLESLPRATSLDCRQLFPLFASLFNYGLRQVEFDFSGFRFGHYRD